MGATDRLRSGLRETEVPDLALRDEVANCACNVLHRHVRIDPVLIVEVDAFDPQTAQRAFRGPADLLGPTVCLTPMAYVDPFDKRDRCVQRTPVSGSMSQPNF